MKTKMKIRIIIATLLAITFSNSYSQKTSKSSMAVLNIQSTGVIPDAMDVGRMVRLELEKTNTYTIMDMYDVNDILKKNNIDITTCFGKNCVLETGKILKTDKMMTGNIERLGEKIVVTLKILNVQDGEVEKSITQEFLNLQPEIERMIEITVKKLTGIEPDPNMVALLINYNQPIVAPQTHLLLNGPRMGLSYTSGETGKRLTAPKNEGGYDMYPCNIQIGWQHEVQYLSSGNFQGLFEFIGLVGGLESGRFVPSVTVLNGFRFGKKGWEFAMGPSFRVVTKADGYYDNDGNWHLKGESNPKASQENNPYDIVSRIDSRGNPILSVGLVLGAGRTFKSGYLNIPVNVYVSPRKEGWIAGISFGFNIHKKPKVEN